MVLLPATKVAAQTPAETSPAETSIDSSCECSRPIAKTVVEVFAAYPSGGTEFARAISTLVSIEPHLVADVVCYARQSRQEVSYSAGLGLAMAEIEQTYIEYSVCCGEEELLTGFYSFAYAKASRSAPQCFDRIASQRMGRMLSPNLSGFGNAGGAGNASGSGDIVVTPAGP